jgi:hypothetical protein
MMVKIERRILGGANFFPLILGKALKPYFRTIAHFTDFPQKVANRWQKYDRIKNHLAADPARCLFLLARLAGFEPATYGLEVNRTAFLGEP